MSGATDSTDNAHRRGGATAGVAGEAGLALVEVLETALNRLLAHDPGTLDRLSALTGRVIGLELTGVGLGGGALRLYLLPHAGGMQILTRYQGVTDTLLSGTPLALAGMSLERDGMRRLFSGEVKISGDIELGQRFKRILDGLDIDWEEWLAHYAGDTLAHRSGRVYRGLRDWVQGTGRTLSLNVSEYLRYEAALLVDREETAQHFDAVDCIRSDVDRLAARVERLARGGQRARPAEQAANEHDSTPDKATPNTAAPNTATPSDLKQE